MGSGTETKITIVKCSSSHLKTIKRETAELRRALQMQANIQFTTTRCQAYIYITIVERQRLFDVKPINIFLKQAKQREVESGKSGLLALQQQTLS